MWGVWMDSKLNSHDVFIDLGHHLLDKCFGVHILTLMKRLYIIKLDDILRVQDKSEPVVLFCWFWNLKQLRKYIGDIVFYPRLNLWVYLK